MQQFATLALQRYSNKHDFRPPLLHSLNITSLHSESSRQREALNGSRTTKLPAPRKRANFVLPGFWVKVSTEKRSLVYVLGIFADRIRGRI